MKTTAIATSLLCALAFAVTAIAQSAGVVLLKNLSTPGLMGGLVVAGLIALARGDHLRNPSFRVRRPFSRPGSAEFRAGLSPENVVPDWNQNTRPT